MQKKISRGNPDEAVTPTSPTEVDFLAQLFSLLPKKYLDKLLSSIEKALLDFLATSGKEWVHLTTVFGKYKIDYGDDIFFTRLFPAWLRFVVLRHVEEVVRNYVKEYRASIAQDVKAGERITKPESPFPPSLKSDLRKHLAMLSAPAKTLKPFFLGALYGGSVVPSPAICAQVDNAGDELHHELHGVILQSRECQSCGLFSPERKPPQVF